MAAVICPQCGAQLSDGPTAPGEAVAVQRCRFCGHAFDGGSGEAVPPAAPALAGPPAAPPGQPSRAPRAVDPLTVPFDMPGDGDGGRPERRNRQWPMRLALLVVVAALATAVMQPQRFGLAPDFWQHLGGRQQDPMVQREVAMGYAALNQGSSRALVAARGAFLRAQRLGPEDATAQAGLAACCLAMADTLTAAADNMAHFSAGLGRKERQRAQREAEAERTEATLWRDQAIGPAQTAVQLDPSLAAGHRAMAELAWLRGDPNGALAWLQDNAIGKDEAPATQALRAAIRLADDANAPTEQLANAVVAMPEDNRLRYRLAVAYLGRHQAPLALEQVNAILASAPEHELAQQMLMRLQPVASQASKSPRPMVLSFQSETAIDPTAPPAAPPAAIAAPPVAYAQEAPGSWQGRFLAVAQGTVQRLRAWVGSVGGAEAGSEARHDSEAPTAAPVAPRNSEAPSAAPVAPRNSEAPSAAPVAPHNSETPTAAPLAPHNSEAPSAAPVAPQKPSAAIATPVAAAAAPAPQGEGAANTLAPGAVPPSGGTPTSAVVAEPVVLDARVQAMSPGNLLTYGQQLRDAHREREALAVYQLAARRSPTDVAGLVGAGGCYLAMGQTAAGLEAFEAAVRQAPWQAEPHFGLAEACRLAERRRDAINHYRRYLAIDPGGVHAPVARQMLEDLSK
jgi:tetratricopeptide (TPR) repeat protein